MILLATCDLMNYLSNSLGRHVSGWEYAVDVSYGVYGAIQKAYHLVRRRRWVRERLLKNPKAVMKKVRQK